MISKIPSDGRLNTGQQVDAVCDTTGFCVGAGGGFFILDYSCAPE